MTRLPIRLRLTLAFALAMAGVLAALSVLVYVRVGDALLSSVDQSLRAQAHEAVTHKPKEGGIVDTDASAGSTLAQIVDRRGRPPALHRLHSLRCSTGATRRGRSTARLFAGQSRFRITRASGG